MPGHHAILAIAGDGIGVTAVKVPHEIHVGRERIAVPKGYGALKIRAVGVEGP